MDGSSPDTRLDLVGLSRAELEAELEGHGLPKFRSRQVWHWIYHRGAKSFDEMTTLTKPLRVELESRYAIGRPAEVVRQDSTDGTHKWLLRFADGREAECGHVGKREI